MTLIRRLPRLKARRIEDLEAECERRIEAGFTSAALGSPHHYPSDERARENGRDALDSARIDGTDEPLWCQDLEAPADDPHDGWAFVDHTPAQIEEVARAFRDHKRRCRRGYARARAAIEAARTRREVNDEPGIVLVTPLRR